MTPRERETLSIILRHVACYNHRDPIDAKPCARHVVMVRRWDPSPTEPVVMVPYPGDIALDGVKFQPTGAKCA